MFGFLPNWKGMQEHFSGVLGDMPLAANPHGGLVCINLRRSAADRVCIYAYPVTLEISHMGIPETEIKALRQIGAIFSRCS